MSDDETTSADAPAEPATAVRVRASRWSMWFGPALLMLFGLAVAVVAWLTLKGTLDLSGRRFRSDLSQVIALMSGVGVLGLALVVLVRACVGKGDLVVIDRGRIRVNTIRGIVDLDLDRVEYITTTRTHGVRSLAVGDADGNIHHPILRPEGGDWDAVAVRLDRLLREHRSERRT